MKSHEIIRASCEKTGVKALASEVGVSQALLYKWMQPCGEDQSGAPNPLDRLVKLLEATRDRAMLEWLCHRMDGFFVENTAGVSPAGEFYPAMNRLLQEFAATLGALAKAGEDHSVTTDEAEMVRHRWNRLKSVCESFVNACERGDFDQMRKELGGTVKHAA